MKQLFKLDPSDTLSVEIRVRGVRYTTKHTPPFLPLPDNLPTDFTFTIDKSGTIVKAFDSSNYITHTKYVMGIDTKVLRWSGYGNNPSGLQNLVVSLIQSITGPSAEPIRTNYEIGIVCKEGYEIIEKSITETRNELIEDLLK